MNRTETIAPRVSVVIPAYNESDSISRGVLDDVVGALVELDWAWEVLLVDDGSQDDTLALMQAFAAEHDAVRCLAEPHRGKGFAILAGMRAAAGSIIAFVDMDQATPLCQLPKLLQWFDRGYDVVIGSRGMRRADAPLRRIVSSWGFTVARMLCVGLWSIHDTQCGFKALSRAAAFDIMDRLKVCSAEAAHSAAEKCVTPGFDVELIYVARRLGYAIKAVPVEWSYRHTHGLNLVRAGWVGVRDLLRIRLAHH